MFQLDEVELLEQVLVVVEDLGVSLGQFLDLALVFV